MNNATNTAAKKLPEIFNFTYNGRDVTYTASYIPAFDKWVCSGADAVGNSYSASQIQYLITSGVWVIVELKKALPSTFKFTFGSDTKSIYTATEDAEGDFAVTWEGQLGKSHYARKSVESNLTDCWHIVEEPLLNCENDASGETSNALFDDAPALSFLNEIIRSKGATEEHIEDEYADICLLQYIKGFVEHTGATVAIDCDGYSIVYDGMEYAAACDCQLTEICGAITTLSMAAV